MDHSALTEALACIFVASNNIATGAVLSYSAVLIPQLEDPDSEINVTKEDISWIASVAALVVPVSTVLSGYVMGRIGRTNMMKLSVGPYIIGCVCMAMAQDLKLLLVGRILTAISVASMMSASIVYITEVARPNWRGALTGSVPTFASLGVVVVYTKGAFLHWRTLAWLSISYSLVPMLLMCLWSPETPVWLVSKGRTQDALKSLTHLCRNNGNEAEQQLAKLVKEHNNKLGDKEEKGSPFENMLRGFAKPNGYKPFIILSVIFAFQQFSGIYVTIFYTVTFIKGVGAAVDPYMSSVAVGVLRLVFGVVTIVLLKRFGRRPLFLLSGSGMAVSMFISGYITQQVATGNMASSVIPMICILMYMVLAVVGLMTIPWIMTAEIFPIEIRGVAQGLISAVGHILMFAMLKIFPFLPDMLGGMHAVQWLFAGVSLGSVLFIFVFLPETHKKQLSEIHEYFNSHTVYVLSSREAAEVRERNHEEGEEMVKLNVTV